MASGLRDEHEKIRQAGIREGRKLNLELERAREVEPRKLWKDDVSMAICRRCKGQCCYVPAMQVVLDREKAERRLKHYKYTYDPKTRGGEIPVLKKKKDGSCVYYDRETRSCTIYNRRPAACRTFFCGRGRKGTEYGLMPKDHIWKRLLREEKENGKPDGDQEKETRVDEIV